jgi:hypothetical protein
LPIVSSDLVNPHTIRRKFWTEGKQFKA